MKKISVFILFLIVCNVSTSQNTVGLLSYDEDQAFEGYNLLFPHNQSSVFLVNNCGELVNIWVDQDFRPGNSVYLNDNGDLIRCKRRTTSAVNDPIWAGGAGEIVDIVSWENQPVASFELNDSLFRLHHDIAPLPNGNILDDFMENKSEQEAIQAGRDTAKLAQDKLWPEAILEWNPSSNEIVWEWHVWDHLIQDYDNQKDNFGNVEEHPELIDLNYDEHDGHPDWLHMNSIDYNPVLDQIAVSIPYFNEMWIIDHSTTKEEAAGHSGGNSDKGGDLLYRWGNPQTYRSGTIDDKQLFFQHDVNWADPQASATDVNFNKIVLFNNRVGSNTSNSNVVDLPWDDATQSYLFGESSFGPDLPSQVVFNVEDGRSNSASLSSAQLLPNNNFLICSGRWGYTYEITPEQDVVWEYITPIKAGERVEQGDTTLSISSNITFRVKRFGADFKGFDGRDLSSIGYVETNPDTNYCALLTPTNDIIISSLRIFPSPSSTHLYLENGNEEIGTVRVFSMTGQMVLQAHFKSSSAEIDIQNLTDGLYVIQTDKGAKKFIKI